MNPIKIEFGRTKVFFISLASALLTLAILFYFYEIKLITALSIPLSSSEYIAGIFNEYLPLAFTVLVLAWIRSERLGASEERKGLKTTILIVASSILAVFVVFRVMDIMFMMLYANINPYSVEMSFAMTWIRFSFYCLFSLILFATSIIFFGLKGLKTLFTISIIPAFYTLNADLVMISNQSNRFPALSILYPLYLLILEFGRLETVALGGLLNLFGFKTLVYTKTFPYHLIMGGSIYLIDLPCIGWEGIVGYTIIFLNLIIEIEKRNKMRVLWWSLGFIGTLFINLFRLILIFAAGAIWGASSAELIHQNAGDAIFLLWILGFTYIIFQVKKRTQI